MTTAEIAYKQASGVDINEQKRIWDERGKGYYGEYLVFNHLYGNIPGQSKILMNCEIPAKNGKTTEIDLLLIHETGIYSFEMKHYKGDIYVNLDSDSWTQYFRTQSNEVFHSPIKQNEYHLSALKEMILQVPMHSFVVFTNEECRLRINSTVVNSYPIDNGVLCLLSSLPQSFENYCSKKENVLTPERIDAIFNQLKPYSKLQNTYVKVDGEPQPILSYFSEFNRAFKDKVEQTKAEYKNLSERVEKEGQELRRNYSKKRNIALAASVLCILLSVLGVVIIPRARIQMAESEAFSRVADVEERYQSFFEKFDDANIVIDENVNTSELVKIENFSIRQAKGLSNAYLVSFTMVGVEGDYALGLTENTRLIIRLRNGDIKECDFFSDDYTGMLRSTAWLQRFGQNGFASIKIENVLVTDIDEEEIEYIKLNNIAVYPQPYANDPILKSVEIEVYNVSP